MGDQDTLLHGCQSLLMPIPQIYGVALVQPLLIGLPLQNFQSLSNSSINYLPRIFSIFQAIRDYNVTLATASLNWLVCWAVKLSTNRTNRSRSFTTSLRVVFIHSTEHTVSAHAFSCQSSSTSGCHVSFSSSRTLFPLLLKIIAILGYWSSLRMHTCKVHCLLSKPDPGWEMRTSECLLTCFKTFYVLF